MADEMELQRKIDIKSSTASHGHGGDGKDSIGDDDDDENENENDESANANANAVAAGGLHRGGLHTGPLRLTDLPPEILEKVLDHLSLRDLRTMWQTCQYLKRVALCPALRAWRVLSKPTYELGGGSCCPRKNLSWSTHNLLRVLSVSRHQQYVRMISTRGLVNDILTDEDALDDREVTSLFGTVPPCVESDDDIPRQEEDEEEEEEVEGQRGEAEDISITIHSNRNRGLRISAGASAATSRPRRRIASGYERRNSRARGRVGDDGGDGHDDGDGNNDDGRRHHLVLPSLSALLLPEDITLYYNVCIARTLVSPTKGWLSLVSLDLSGCNFNEKILVEKIRQGNESGFDPFPQLEFVSVANQPLHSGILVLAFAKYCPKVVEICAAGIPRFWNEESGEKLREKIAELQRLRKLRLNALSSGIRLPPRINVECGICSETLFRCVESYAVGPPSSPHAEFELYTSTEPVHAVLRNVVYEMDEQGLHCSMRCHARFSLCLIDQGTGTVNLRGYSSAVLCGPEPIPRASDEDPQARAEIQKTGNANLFNDNTSPRQQSRGLSETIFVNLLRFNNIDPPVLARVVTWDGESDG